MAEPRRLERLTGQELLMLLADDFGWSEDIGVLAVLDGTRLLGPDGRVRVDEVRRRLEPRLHLVPRFRHLLYRPRWGLGRPLWVDAPAFDIADHVRLHPLPATADEAQLLAACARLYRRRLNPTRPLWEAWLLPGLPGRRVGLFLRVHHTMVDGVAGMAALGALLDLDADAPSPVAPPWTPGPIPTAGELVRDNLRRRLRALGCGLWTLTHPRRRAGSSGVWREFLAERAPPTPASTARSGRSAGWRSSAAGWTSPSGSPTPTGPRSTTWSWPPWPGACAGCWPPAARTSRTWSCA
jgi:diacylglycerol O-acyltransferase